ncbi:MAG TPA: hypothetical protein VFG78_03515 [Gemmatimonadota bacterium]|nr:hypothetical protein [Gemmatimonadota bacterium]
MIRRAYLGFLLLTVAWLTAGVAVYDRAYGFHLAKASIWWGLVIMLIATAYYLIQEAPAARVSGWLRRDLAINTVLFLILLGTVLDGVNGHVRLGLAGAGWVAVAVALLHPVLVDRAHHRHHREDPAGSPVPQYVPPACVWIDGTLAGLVLLAIQLL